MYLSPNTCNICWQGQYVNGICSSCQSKMVSPAERRVDALPLHYALKNRYIIGDVLGKGGFGITYSAWDNQSNRRVALKELYPRNDVYRDSGCSVRIPTGKEQDFTEMVRRFEDEARLLMLLDGDCGSLKVYDLFRANGTVYYSMEFLDGFTLKTYLEKNHGGMKWEVLYPMILEILRTLDALHAKNLIHRDISPDNLFLTKDNRLRLIDFGSVRTYEGATTFTKFLKPHFTPIEQYSSVSPQGPFTDLYALSVTLYMLLTNKVIPKAPERLTGAKVIPLSTLRPDVPAQAAQVIEKGMNVKASQRYQTAAEYYKALTGKDIRPGPGPGPAPEGPKVVTQSDKRVYWVEGVVGVYANRRAMLERNMELRFGRNMNNFVPYPMETYGVSRNHCSVYISATGDIFVKDNKSSYGTFLNDQRVGQNWVKVPSGSYLRLGGEVLKLYYTNE